MMHMAKFYDDWEYDEVVDILDNHAICNSDLAKQIFSIIDDRLALIFIKRIENDYEEDSQEITIKIRL
jgi:hypothetical protein